MSFRVTISLLLHLRVIINSNNLKFFKMKTLIKLFAALVIINLTACQDEIIPETGSVTEVDEVGDGLPQIYDVNDLVKKEKTFTDKDFIRSIPEPFSIENYEHIKDVQSTSRSRGVEGITFGHTVNSTTVGQGNSIDKNFGYSGEDRVYKLEVHQSSDVELMLKNLRVDLDLYVAKALTDAYGRELVGDLIASSQEYATRDEHILVKLEAGEYFIIVDSYRTSGSFTLIVGDVIGDPLPFCEDHENLYATSDRSNGVSRQTETWTKWSPLSTDGLVLYEDSRLQNKVVKFDARRFGGQDAVRTLIGLPITSGLYTMDFKLYVPHGNSANFLSEKKVQTGNYANQGFMVRVKSNGTMEFTQGGRVKTSRIPFPQGKWVNVFMAFDLETDIIYLIINNSVGVHFRASAGLYNRGDYLKSIAGIDFFNNYTSDRFHIDDICVEEIEPGYDNPYDILSVNSLEEEISFID